MDETLLPEIDPNAVQVAQALQQGFQVGLQAIGLPLEAVSILHGCSLFLAQIVEAISIAATLPPADHRALVAQTCRNVETFAMEMARLREATADCPVEPNKGT